MKADFQSRPEFTDPEILRTNLGVRYFCKWPALKLGDIRKLSVFTKAQMSVLSMTALRLLEELQAIKPKRKGQRGNLQLTPGGQTTGSITG